MAVECDEKRDRRYFCGLFNEIVAAYVTYFADVVVVSLHQQPVNRC